MTCETALLMILISTLVNGLVSHFLHRRMWRAIDDLRGKRAPLTKGPRQSRERRVMRAGASPDVRTVDDSGERVRPGRPI